jgi:hypothetical protein
MLQPRLFHSNHAPIFISGSDSATRLHFPLRAWITAGSRAF